MATCPECDAEVEVDELSVEKGEIIECFECGARLEVIRTSPLELELAPDDEDELEDEDEEEDDDEEDDDEDEDEDEDDDEEWK